MGTLAAALVLYLVWTLATYLLEGRLETLRRPEATFDRLVYTGVANFVIGLGAGCWALGRWVRPALSDLRAAGLVRGRAAVAGIAAGAALGVAFVRLRGDAAHDAVVLINVFSQTFPVSVAEIVVCWAVLGAATRAAFSRERQAVGTAVAAVVSSGAFGLYHFAHSPPFDTVGMVGLLTVVGLFTSTFFFASRNLYGTILFHNFLALTGVTRALAGAGNLETYSEPRPATIATALLAAACLLLGHQWLETREGVRSSRISADPATPP